MPEQGAIIPRETVAAALAELARLDAGHVPDAAELAAAPLLTDYIVEPCAGGIRLYGVVSGHPTIEDGWCTTSPVIAADEAQMWCRTVSRYYRLGRPLIARETADA